MMWLRHALSIAILPFTVTVLVPLWIARQYNVTFGPGREPAALLIQLAGFALLGLGLFFFIWSLRRFAVEGKGTLAPWDPPRELVVLGPYRYVRNPMISGVLLVLCAEAALLRSWPHAIWALVFLGLNAVFILAFEEPQLAARFGEPYREYCRHVPRVIPRWRPWEPGRPGAR